MVRGTRPWILLCAGLMAASADCAPRVDEGQFRCDPHAQRPCPPGYQCLLQQGIPEHRCYSQEGEYCGDGVAGDLEPCDGHDLSGLTCWDFGFFRGNLRCDSLCEVDVSDCLNLESIDLGGYYACGVDEARQGWCWGSAPNLGAVTTTPTAVPGGHELQNIVVGEQYACGLDTEGTAWCWGKLENLGIGSLYQAVRTPVRVDGEHRFDSLSAGSNHCCGVDSGGSVWCWGLNSHGQTGSPERGIWTYSLYPMEVVSTSDFTRVSVGERHSCALDADGQAWCWGASTRGELGIGAVSLATDDGTYLPAPVAGGLTLSALSAGYTHTCGLDPAGQAFCWGHNGGVDFSETSEARNLTPVPTQPNLRFLSLNAGAGMTCGIAEAGEAWCWDRTEDSARRILEGVSLTSLSLGTRTETYCGVATDGRAVCQGWNGGWLMGVDSPGNRPRKIAATEPFAELVPGQPFSCALDQSGGIRCLGEGILGHGYLRLREWGESVVVGGVASPVQLGVGLGYACALDVDHQVWCWGQGFWGALGIGSWEDATTPAAVAGGHRFHALSTGFSHACSLDEEGRAWCWGLNLDGQLGDNSWSDAAAPVAVAGDHRFTDISVMNSVSCALENGLAWCWGSNVLGQLGSSSAGDVELIPHPVDGDHSLSAITTTSWGACGLDTDQRVWCWGEGSAGQIGNGYFDNSFTPSEVSGGHRFVAIHGGTDFVCALDMDQRVWCWGSNNVGQLADGSYTDRATPTLVVDAHRFVSLSMGYSQTCGVATDGQIWCWGLNSNGQLAIDDFIYSPTQVSSPAE